MLQVDKAPPAVEYDITGMCTPSQVKKIGEAFRKAYKDYVKVVPLLEDKPPESNRSGSGDIVGGIKFF